ncbi:MULTISPECIES: PIG-L deacetylase family protein [Eubacterium]|uniref:N-acetylglucosaminyl deacetylase, LmbE family n=1 Tax=Eubacterium barkeri TaxID=1528 RepID=A0A1H3GE19_EUBBA|nr:PIG-L family deacetylase [Eubacterium barkeri]SDY01516.1 N-acetylglucosaminyl deacetylase, LmbE family [Eubacterium barkeri]
MKKVLVVAAHPDDEILGVGGTVAKHVKNGDEVTSIVLCEGESLRYGKNIGQSKAMEKAGNMLGVKRVIQLMFPDQKLDTYTLTDIISPLEKISNEIKPNIIYSQFGGDINMDHQLLFQASNVAFRPLDSWIEEFYAFYTVSSTEWGFPRSFIPDTWVDISQTLKEKIAAFACYKSEIREYPHPRSQKALEYVARFWGNQCVMDAAEAFMTIRNIKR